MRTLLVIGVCCLAAGCGDGARAPADASVAADARMDGGMARIVDLETGGENNCVLLWDRTVRCWGEQLPAGVDALAGDVDQVAVGATEVCVRRGTVIECLGAPRDPSNPITDEPVDAFVDVDADLDHACARTSDRRVVCWGDAGPAPAGTVADELRLGGQGGVCVRDGTSATWFYAGRPPMPIPGEIARLAPPDLWGRCALTTAGEVTCQTTCVFLPDLPELCPSSDWTTEVGTGPGGAFVQLELPSEQWYACGLRASGAIVCWGSDYDTAPPGEMPLRDLEPAGVSFREIGVGQDHVCGVTTDDRVVCWGHRPAALDVPAELR